jgi:adenylate cyclase
MGDRGFESSPSGGETVANLTSSIRVDPGRMAPGLAGLRVGAFWELGVRYVLEGSVRKASGRVRITAQLIEAESGAHLWADRFDGSLEDVFDLQDQIAIAVAGIIEPTLQLAEVQRASPRPTTDLAAYDLYLRAYARMLSPARNTPEVLRLLDEAIARDPDFGPALAWAGICHIWIDCVDAIGGCDDPEGNRRKGLERGRRALQVAGDDPAILANTAFTLAYLGEDVGAMIALADRALRLNPSFAHGWHASGGVRLIAGQPDVAVEHVETSMRLSPRARVGWGLAVIGIAHFAARRFEAAIPKLLLATQEDPNFATSYRYLAASYAHLGRLSAARDAIAQLRAVVPHIGMDSILRNADQHELYLSGLRLAAGEAT